MNICDTCLLNGRCDGRCGDIDPLVYDFEEQNDSYEHEASEENE